MGRPIPYEVFFDFAYFRFCLQKFTLLRNAAG